MSYVEMLCNCFFVRLFLDRRSYSVFVTVPFSAASVMCQKLACACTLLAPTRVLLEKTRTFM